MAACVGGAGGRRPPTADGAPAADRPAILESRGARADARGRAAQLLADALAPGKDDPGQPHATKPDETIATAERHAQACAILEQRALDALRDVLEEHGDDWSASLEAELTEARQAWHELLNLVGDSIQHMHAIQALRRFADKGRYMPPPAVAPFVGTPTIAVDEAIAALRGFAKPVEPV